MSEDGAKSAFLYSRESNGIRCTCYELPKVECHSPRVHIYEYVESPQHSTMVRRSTLQS